MPRLASVTDRTLDSQVLRAPAPVVVLFAEPQSPAGRVLIAVLEQIAGERRDLRIVRIDPGTAVDVADRYEIGARPTLVIFRAGLPYGRIDGTPSKAVVQKQIDKALARRRPIRPSLLERLGRRAAP